MVFVTVHSYITIRHLMWSLFFIKYMYNIAIWQGLSLCITNIKKDVWHVKIGLCAREDRHWSKINSYTMERVQVIVNREKQINKIIHLNSLLILHLANHLETWNGNLHNSQLLPGAVILQFDPTVKIVCVGSAHNRATSLTWI